MSQLYNHLLLKKGANASSALEGAKPLFFTCPAFLFTLIGNSMFLLGWSMHTYLGTDALVPRSFLTYQIP